MTDPANAVAYANEMIKHSHKNGCSCRRCPNKQCFKFSAYKKERFYEKSILSVWFIHFIRNDFYVMYQRKQEDK